jgi:hypothetical protein
MRIRVDHASLFIAAAAAGNGLCRLGRRLRTAEGRGCVSTVSRPDRERNDRACVSDPPNPDVDGHAHGVRYSAASAQRRAQ